MITTNGLIYDYVVFADTNGDVFANQYISSLIAKRFRVGIALLCLANCVG
jgi:hypothetical protein